MLTEQSAIQPSPRLPPQLCKQGLFGVARRFYLLFQQVGPAGCTAQAVQAGAQPWANTCQGRLFRPPYLHALPFQILPKRSTPVLCNAVCNKGPC